MMKIKDFYKKVIEVGINNDLRDKKQITKILKERKKNYEKLKGKYKSIYDIEKLSNPYDDTRILNLVDNKEIKNILAGIDIETQEILLADTLRENKKKIDLILTHHPEGKAYASFYEVMDLQADVMNKLGVPINIAEKILEPRIGEVKRRVMPANHNRAVEAAGLLKFNFLGAHTPADNCVTKYLQNLFDKKKPERLKDIIDILLDIPEYFEAGKRNNAPEIFIGKAESRCGKVFVDMTGGTGGPKEAMKELAKAGIGTIVGMHMSEDNRKAAEKNKLNVVIAGHMASDSLGMNLLLSQIFNKQKVNIIPISGYIYIKR